MQKVGPKTEPRPTGPRQPDGTWCLEQQDQLERGSQFLGLQCLSELVWSGPCSLVKCGVCMLWIRNHRTAIAITHEPILLREWVWDNMTLNGAAAPTLFPCNKHKILMLSPYQLTIPAPHAFTNKQQWKTHLLLICWYGRMQNKQFVVIILLVKSHSSHYFLLSWAFGSLAFPDAH